MRGPAPLHTVASSLKVFSKLEDWESPAEEPFAAIAGYASGSFQASSNDNDCIEIQSVLKSRVGLNAESPRL